ncbi:DNA-processing protein DprA [Pseudaquabacterium pictum]|uniref:DNA processing protein DprA n=1 Tax=Pseudaquabacterium pictum TaxID=2315236 RepID=A0A480AYQ2_9BURK|nr:DNA-processing protein DprA [Rubrivivax pictus]GCL63938.1 DNA processing protein DprA [Rubrivivax pictus]
MTDPQELGAWLHLLHSPGVGRTTARRLLARFLSPQAAIAAPVEALRDCVDAPTALTLATPPDGHAERLAATLAWQAAAPGRRVLVLGDADYPAPLLHSADPPLLLYLQGDASLLTSPCLAMVGSRQPSAQGRDNARRFAEVLAGQGWTIVSGLAAGVDGAAHAGALAAGGRTIAVVGTGIDRVYPPSHRALAHRIAETGLLVSEYALGTPPLAANFPPRNRIIAGLSRGTLVVEAALRSGSLITARLASEAGREVLAIPGSILAPQSAGCHALIRQGAALVDSPEQVAEELGPLQPVALPVRQAAPPAADPAGETDPVLAALGHDPQSLDTLIDRCGWPAHTLSAHLLTLELDGRVARLPGGLYQRRQGA